MALSAFTSAQLTLANTEPCGTDTYSGYTHRCWALAQTFKISTADDGPALYVQL